MRFLLAFLFAVLAIGPVRAQPSDDGYFIARRACAATQSIRGADPVAAASLETDRAYHVVAENKQPATHYLIEVPGAAPSRRWVARECGERVAAVPEAAPTGEGAVKAGTAASAGAAPDGPSTRNILAISWQPAFCEGLSNKPECRTQTAQRADASRFSLHGLWPQPRTREYCGAAASLRSKRRSGDWKDLPAPALAAETRARLETAMPGTQSFLDRHEWARHGTCYGADAETYFGEMLALLDAVNASPVAKLFASRVGREVGADEIRAAFDESFGKGAGERVRVSCRNDGSRRIIDELTIGLVGDVAPRPDVARLMLASSATKVGCPRGIVDAVGLQ